MIFLVPVIALVIGYLIAYRFGQPVGGFWGQYLAVASLAGLDTICGGIRSILEAKFNNEVFVSGFVFNVLIAFFLAWLGDKIYIDLYIAVALVLGARIFTNLSLIRRYLLTKWQDARERERLRREARAQAQISAEASGNNA